MKTLTSIENRNNGRDRYIFTPKKRNFSISEDKYRKYLSRDVSLFNMAKTLNVKTNCRQRVRWIFNISKCTDEVIFKHNIESVCLRYGFVGRRNITIDLKGLTRRLVLDTPIFLFTLDNVKVFSSELYNVSKSSSAYYERWEVVPRDNDLIQKIRKVFRILG
jgi:hypothetical protein